MLLLPFLSDYDYSCCSSHCCRSVSLTAAALQYYYCYPYCLVLQLDRAGTWRAAEAADDRTLDINAADALYILGAVQV